MDNLQERIKEMEVVSKDGLDQISRLPDDILVKILTLLPTLEAVRSSFVSKRWKYLWTSIPILDLNFRYFSELENSNLLVYLNRQFRSEAKEKFLRFVEYVFNFSEVNDCHKLRFAVNISHFKLYDSRIHMLVTFAMRKKCTILDLDFSGGVGGIRDPICPLPPCSFANESLTDLKLTRCEFRSSIYKNFVSLKTVILTTVELPGDSIYHLISNSPCLEELELIMCSISSHLNFHYPNSTLKAFVMDWCDNGSDEILSFCVNIPNLSRFKFAGMPPEHFSIKSGENLIEAEINLEIYNEQQIHIHDILKDLHNVKILTLCSSCLEVLCANDGLRLRTTFYNLRHLTIKPNSEHRELLTLSCLLRSAPYVETISIHFFQEFEDDVSSMFDDYGLFWMKQLWHPGIYDFEEDVRSSMYDEDGTFWRPDLLPSAYVNHLKSVEIKGFYGGTNEMELVKILLKNSLSLEKMVIYKEEMESRCERVKDHGNAVHMEVLQRQHEKIMENLFAFARGSSAAQVIIE